MVFEHFDFALPELTNIISVTADFHDDHLDIIAYVSDRHTTILAFINALNAIGFESEEGSNTHIGTLTLGDIEIYYHESHSDATKLEIVISTHEHE